MALLEAIFFWITVAILGIGSCLVLFSFIFKKPLWADLSFYISLSAFLSLSIAIISRYKAVGNLPVAGEYESSLGGVWFIMLFYIILSSGFKGLRPASLGIFPFCLLLLGFGFIEGPVLAPMAAAVRSFWLYVHVFFAWLAFGAFTVCFGLGIIYLLKEKNPQKEFYARFPELVRIEELMFRYLVFGFITDAIMIASGAIWAKNLWGHYWNWDPVETWSLITWLIYGLTIHLRLTMGWRGRRFAWLMILGLPGMAITYFGIDILVSSSLHIFKAWQEF